MGINKEKRRCDIHLAVSLDQEKAVQGIPGMRLLELTPRAAS